MTKIDDYCEMVYHTPWGQMFYQILWAQLEPYAKSSRRILDFGSGFGKTSEHLAVANEAVAYEPNHEMLTHTYHEVPFTQLTGDFQAFKEQIAGETFDLILLHNVLEYVGQPKQILEELTATKKVWRPQAIQT